MSRCPHLWLGPRNAERAWVFLAGAWWLSIHQGHVLARGTQCKVCTHWYSRAWDGLRQPGESRPSLLSWQAPNREALALLFATRPPVLDARRACRACLLARVAPAAYAGVNPSRQDLAQWTLTRVMNMQEVQGEGYEYGPADYGARRDGSSLSGSLVGAPVTPTWTVFPDSGRLVVKSMWVGYPLDQTYIQWKASTEGYRSVQLSFQIYDERGASVPPFVLQASPDASFSSAATVLSPVLPTAGVVQVRRSRQP